jgi:hypothetical protein
MILNSGMLYIGDARGDCRSLLMLQKSYIEFTYIELSGRMELTIRVYPNVLSVCKRETSERMMFKSCLYKSGQQSIDVARRGEDHQLPFLSLLVSCLW